MLRLCHRECLVIPRCNNLAAASRCPQIDVQCKGVSPERMDYIHQENVSEFTWGNVHRIHRMRGCEGNSVIIVVPSRSRHSISAP